MSIADYKKEKEKEKKDEKLFGLLEVIAKPQDQIDTREYLDRIREVLESQSNEDIVKAIKESKVEKTDISGIEKLLSVIIDKIKPIIIPEYKVDTVTHKILNEIKSGVLVPVPKYPTPKDYTKALVSIINGLSDVERAVKKINISFHSGGGTDNSLLQQLVDKPTGGTANQALIEDTAVDYTIPTALLTTIILLKITNTSTNTITISTEGTEKIAGADTFNLPAGGEAVLTSTGAHWEDIIVQV